jgi:hypothetical protein
MRFGWQQAETGLSALWHEGVEIDERGNFLRDAIGDAYSPARPGPNPTAGFLLAGFVICMFVSCGVWGALVPILRREVAIPGALVTGILLFVGRADQIMRVAAPQGFSAMGYRKQ